MSLVHDSTLQKVVLTDPDNNFGSYGDSNPMPNEITARTSINSAGTHKHLLCDADGHLQVDIVSGGGGGGGDATAANQSTMISHLSDIDTAVTGTLNVSDSTAQLTLSSIETAVMGTLAVSNSDLVTLAGTVTANEIAVVSKGGSWSSLVNYASPSLESLGTNTTAAVPSKMGQYYAIQFSGSVDGQFSVFVEESIDNSTYVRDLADINYSNQQNLLYRHNFSAPFFRFFVQNNSASTQTVTINYVNAL